MIFVWQDGTVQHCSNGKRTRGARGQRYHIFGSLEEEDDDRCQRDFENVDAEWIGNSVAN